MFCFNNGLKFRRNLTAVGSVGLQTMRKWSRCQLNTRVKSQHHLTPKPRSPPNLFTRKHILVSLKKFRSSRSDRHMQAAVISVTLRYMCPSLMLVLWLHKAECLSSRWKQEGWDVRQQHSDNVVQLNCKLTLTMWEKEQTVLLRNVRQLHVVGCTMTGCDM